MNHARIITTTLITALLGVACSADVSPDVAAPDGLPETGTLLEHPQIVATADGGLVITWTRREGQSVDLFMSSLAGGAFAPPVRVNDIAGSVNRLPIDEMRQAVATGLDGRLAVAWTDADFDIRLSVSDDGGQSFQPSLRLNRDEGDALQEFPAIDFDDAGTIHAVWLDPRGAPAGFEEPADLYYTAFSPTGELLDEINLTQDQESSVCGCCLPHIQARDDGTLAITFRNTTADGYRDPFRIVGTQGGFTSPAPVSPPVWQIDACPIAGPIGVGNKTLWLDSSTGTQRLLSAVDPDTEPEAVFEDTAENLLLLPPRLVSGLPADAPVVLVPMADNSRLIVPDGNSWRVVADDLPFWVTSAAVYDGQLLLAGTAEGFQFETRPFGQ